MTFEVRAMIEDPETGEEIVTDWVDMVEGEDQIVHVQYRTTHRPAPSYAQREEMTVDDTDRGIREYGWRAPADLAEEQVELFEPYARQAGDL